MKTLKSLRRAVAPVFLGSLLSAQVGINTDLPTKTLDVNGTFRARGLDNGTSLSIFDQVLVAPADGTVGTASRNLFSGGAGSRVENYHIYNTAARSNITNSSLVLQPGMSKTLTLTAPAKVTVWATIGASLPVGATGTVNVDVAIFINNVIKSQGGYNRFSITGSGVRIYNTVAITTMQEFPAGTHTIDLRTGLAEGTSVPGLTIGGAASDINPGEMTIQVLY